MRSKRQRLGEPARSPRPRRDGPRSARPSPAGVARTCAWLPRRSGSDASSVVCSRTATNASCSRARSGVCAWTFARRHARHAQARRRARRGRGSARGRGGRTGAGARRGSASRPKAPQQPAHRRLVAHAAGGRSRSGRRALGVLLDVVERDRRRPSARRAGRLARVRVRAREQPAEVAPARARRGRAASGGGRLDRRGGPSRTLISAPWIARSPSALRRLRELHRARDRVVVGQRERRVPALDRRRHELLGQRGPVEEREGRVAVELDVGHEHMFAYAAGDQEFRPPMPLGEDSDRRSRTMVLKASLEDRTKGRAMDSFTCVLAFDTDDAEFVRGVELGRSWERLCAQPAPLLELVHVTSAEMVLRVADALGKPVIGAEHDGTWMTVRFELRPPRPDSRRTRSRPRAATAAGLARAGGDQACALDGVLEPAPRPTPASTPPRAPLWRRPGVDAQARSPAASSRRRSAAETATPRQRGSAGRAAPARRRPRRRGSRGPTRSSRRSASTTRPRAAAARPPTSRRSGPGSCAPAWTTLDAVTMRRRRTTPRVDAQRRRGPPAGRPRRRAADHVERSRPGRCAADAACARRCGDPWWSSSDPRRRAPAPTRSAARERAAGPCSPSRLGQRGGGPAPGARTRAECGRACASAARFPAARARARRRPATRAPAPRRAARRPDEPRRPAEAQLPALGAQAPPRRRPRARRAA